MSSYQKLAVVQKRARDRWLQREPSVSCPRCTVGLMPADLDGHSELDAQEASQSDKMRAKEYRARNRDKALGIVTPRDATVTNRDATVTGSDDTVTLASPSDPSRPSRASEKKKREKKNSNSAPDAAGFQPRLGGLAEKKIRELYARGDPRTDIDREIAKWAAKRNGGAMPSDDDDASIAGWLQLHEDWLEKQGIPKKSDAQPTKPKATKATRTSNERKMSTPPDVLPRSVYYKHPTKSWTLLAYTEASDEDYKRVYLGTYEVRRGRITAAEHEPFENKERIGFPELNALEKVTDIETYFAESVEDAT